MAKYIILEHNPIFNTFAPKRWGFSGEIVLYDTRSDALHDCNKGDKIIPQEQLKSL